jgi:hypothetical protein
VRECKVYSTIVRFDTPAAEIAALKPKGLILSGGPASVYAKGAAAPTRHFRTRHSDSRHLLRRAVDGASFWAARWRAAKNANTAKALCW